MVAPVNTDLMSEERLAASMAKLSANSNIGPERVSSLASDGGPEDRTLTECQTARGVRLRRYGSFSSGRPCETTICREAGHG